jgi:sulfatase-like protein
VASLIAAALLVAAKAPDQKPEASSPPARKATVAVSRRPPVVLLILDEFPPDSLLEPDGHIDAVRFPNFAALAETSTWFPNAHTIYDFTFKAVPAILDARLPRQGSKPDGRDHPLSIYDLFGRHGYQIVHSEPATALCPRRYCPGARLRHPRVIFRLNDSGRPGRLRRWIDAMRPRPRPTLYVSHTLLPHEPWLYLPSGKQMRPAGYDPIRYINRPQGFHDPALTQHNHQRYMLQLGFMDRELGRLMRRLRSTGLLNRALVAVTADHGFAFEVGVEDRREVSPSNVDEIAPVPLFIKAPGQRRARVDRSYVRSIDIVPTIADMLGLRIDWPHDGRSAFSPRTRRRRVVRLVTRDFAGVVAIGARRLERRRRANVERRVRLFGTGAQSLLLLGSPWGRVYHVGRPQGLLGRRVNGLRVIRAGRPRARIANAPLARAVRRSSMIVPLQVEGRIHPGRPGAKRHLAVAVNGVIQGLGRSFRLEGIDGEFFSVLVPEHSLRPGRNDVRVFELFRRGRSLALAPLGSN